MAQAEGRKGYFTFVAGLNTEASPLTFPENASLDEENFTLNVDGSRSRRLGIDYETSYTKFSIDNLFDGVGHTFSADTAISVHPWHNVNGNASLNFVVVQVGIFLFFYPLVNGQSLSGNKHADVISIASHLAPAAVSGDARTARIETAYGKGVLFVVGPHNEPFYIEYDEAGDTFTSTTITLYERDVEGVDDSLEVSTRPTILTSEHLYNLQNQGWTETSINSFKTSEAVYPSNSDIESLGYYINPGTGREAWSSAEVITHSFGSTPAPKGSFIRDVFDTTLSNPISLALDVNNIFVGTTMHTISTSVAHGFSNGDEIVLAGTRYTFDTGSGCPGSTTKVLDGTYTISDVTSTTFNIAVGKPTSFVGMCDETYGTATKTVDNPAGIVEDYRPQTVAFYAGRVWYSGVKSARLGSRVYFSQIIQTDSEFGKCYQSADPTSREISDLVASDGGMVSIPEIGEVKKMVVVGTDLILFADNGIWAVSGGDAGFFTATSFSIRKLTSVGISSPASVVIADGVPLFASKQGLYMLQQDKISGFLTAVSVSQDTIQSLYKAIADADKTNIVGVYDDVDKKVYWLYSTGTPTYNYMYDECIVLDLRLNAFYKYTFPTGSVYIAGAVASIGYDESEAKIKFFTVETAGTYSILFSCLCNESFLDWYTYDSTGVDAAAYVVTGYELAEDAMVAKQAPYIICYLNRTETSVTEDGNGDLQFDNPSSCTMQARWDWADHTNSGKFSSSQEVYRLRRLYTPSGAGSYEDGYPVVVTKNKVRGKGKALSLKFSTTAGKDCQLLGWAISFGANVKV